MATEGPDWFRRIGRILNSRQSQTIVLTGNISDLYLLCTGGAEDYVPLLTFLLSAWDLPQLRNLIKVVYELNSPIRFLHEGDIPSVRDAWSALLTGMAEGDRAIHRIARPASSREEPIYMPFEDALKESAGSPTFALELLRQMCLVLACVSSRMI
jgi:hypothetical protein